MLLDCYNWHAGGREPQCRAVMWVRQLLRAQGLMPGLHILILSCHIVQQRRYHLLCQQLRVAELC